MWDNVFRSWSNVFWWYGTYQMPTNLSNQWVTTWRREKWKNSSNNLVLPSLISSQILTKELVVSEHVDVTSSIYITSASISKTNFWKEILFSWNHQQTYFWQLDVPWIRFFWWVRNSDKWTMRLGQMGNDKKWIGTGLETKWIWWDILGSISGIKNVPIQFLALSRISSRSLKELLIKRLILRYNFWNNGYYPGDWSTEK